MKKIICVAVGLLLVLFAVLKINSEIITNEHLFKENKIIVANRLIEESTTEKNIEEMEYLETENCVEIQQSEMTIEEFTVTQNESSENNETLENEILYSATEFRYMGVIYWNDWKWTWYSEKILPGGGLDIPGRHADGNGYICDENNYICLASSSLNKGMIIKTPFGKYGKIYDTGCSSSVIDVYVNW